MCLQTAASAPTSGVHSGPLPSRAHHDAANQTTAQYVGLILQR